MTSQTIDQQELDRDLLVDEGPFYVDPYLRDLLPEPMSATSSLLSEMLAAENAHVDHVVVWDEENILVDGHRRWKILKEAGKVPPIRRQSFGGYQEVINWMIKLQLSRRSMPDHDQAMFTHLYLRQQQAAGVTKDVARKDLEEATGRSKRSLQRDDAYGKAFKSITESWQDAINSRKLDPSRKGVIDLASLNHRLQEALLKTCLAEGDDGPLRRRFADPPPVSKTTMPEPQRENAKPGRNNVSQHKPVVQPVPEVVKDRSDDADVTQRLIEVEKASAGFARATDRLFSEDGLGRHTSASHWKKQVDEGHRLIARSLQKVRDNDMDG